MGESGDRDRERRDLDEKEGKKEREGRMKNERW